MRKIVETAQQIIDDLRIQSKQKERKIVAISGAPGSGKSTFSQVLKNELNKSQELAAVIPMDGYHLDNALLEGSGLLNRKGAPETFDFYGFKHLMNRVKKEDEVIYPVFDRDREISVAGAGILKKETKLVIVEGNYLLFDEQPWFSLCGFWDYSVFLEVDYKILERRLIDRWIHHGFSLDDARRKALGNDIPNAKRVIAARCHANRIIKF